MATEVEPLLEDIMLVDMRVKLLGTIAVLSHSGRERLRNILHDAQQALWDMQARTRF